MAIERGEPPKCKMCDNTTKWNSQHRRYGIYCSSKCSASDPDKKAKQASTVLAKYGTNNPLKNSLVAEKSATTKIEKYGDEHYTNPDKRTTTNLDRYGVNYPLQNKDIRKKATQSILDTYGVSNIRKVTAVNERIKSTNLKKHGVDNPLKSPHVRAKIAQTNLDRYGATWITQTNLILDGQARSCQDKSVTHLSRIGKQSQVDLLSDYNWIFDQYVVQNKTAAHIANELGLDQTTIGKYLRGHKITIDHSFNYSYVCLLWLESIMETEGIYIQHAMNGGEFKIPGTRWKADGYCAETNTIYEFHGDYWHGNPLIYEPDFYNKSRYMSMGELYKKTIEREANIKELGYNLVVKWETEES